MLTRLTLTLAVLFSSTLTLALPPSEGTLSAAQGRPSTEQILKQLGGVPCPDDSAFTCVTLIVPLDHFNPADARTLSVTFAVLPAAGNRKGMFITVTGGPGTSGIAAADSYTAAFDPSIPRRFDIVFFDQRGATLSGGLACPQAAVAFYQSDFRAVTPAQETALNEAARAFSTDCVSEMGRPEALPFYGTAQAIEDLELFRQLMQDEKFWLYGESYGTQYAQTYAAEHGEHLAGLLLDGTVDLTLTGFEYYAQQAQAFNAALVAALEACQVDPACAADFGQEAVSAYDQLAQRLQQEALSLRFPLANGRATRRDFTFADLEVTAAGQAYSEGDRMLFNRALAAYSGRRDLIPLTRLLYANLGLDPQTLTVVPDLTYSDAMFYAVECQDYGYPGATPEARAANYLRAGDPVEAAVPRLASLFYGDLPCASWPDATTNLSRPAPLTALGVPTLVLGATADPATPYDQGVSVYRRLADGYLITQQGGPHVIFGRGVACVDDLVTDFLVKDRAPAQRETTCDGAVTNDYVPLAPVSAQEFETPLEALASLETEINYLPEYYYWDGVEPTGAGCGLGGSLHFKPDGKRYVFSLAGCTFTRGFSVTGTGAYAASNDRFVLDVSTAGRWNCALRYVRAGDKTRVTGKCNGSNVHWER
jgi:pimeloyl-ACP methyl ester carboxylesterase